MPGGFNNHPLGPLRDALEKELGLVDLTPEQMRRMRPRRIPVPTGTVGDNFQPLDLRPLGGDVTPPPGLNHLYDSDDDTPPTLPRTPC